ncbi:MAG: hypothetical protein ABJJ05_14650 [Maribacter litoralis]|uniref:hypothetical protein n=1 Tax=Maribacter litoralis TaxID=2059726 RepID=UPI00329A097A
MRYVSEKCWTIVFIILSGTHFSFGQEKQNFTDINGHYVIKERWVVSQIYADSVEKEELDSRIKKGGSTNDFITPTPPGIAVFDRKSNIHFLIESEQFIFYKINDEFKSDTPLSVGISSISQIDRINKKMKSFSPNRFETGVEHEIIYKNDDRFQLMEVNKNMRRQICNRDCFQVILNDTNTNRQVEMYVTEEMIIEYNPVLNVKKYLTDYYPLYLKFYDPKFPEDNFREYEFYKLK